MRELVGRPGDMYGTLIPDRAKEFLRRKGRNDLTKSDIQWHATVVVGINYWSKPPHGVHDAYITSPAGRNVRRHRRIGPVQPREQGLQVGPFHGGAGPQPQARRRVAIGADIEGHPDQTSVRLALEELGFFSRQVTILGVYPASPHRGTAAAD